LLSKKRNNDGVLGNIKMLFQHAPYVQKNQKNAFWNDDCISEKVHTQIVEILA
jgi:hypothetical protein